MSACVRIQRSAEPSCIELRLSNPARKNAISAGMWRAIAEFAADVGGDASVRVVLIRGDGAPFSAGADISDFLQQRSSGEAGASYDDLVEATCRAVEAIPQPTVAAIEGVCFGAGLSLAASCDLRLAADDASFCVPAARLGLGYDIRGIARFHRVFGVPTTTQMLLTAGRVTALRAHALGAVQATAPPAEVTAHTERLIAQLAANAPLTLRAAKAATRALTGGDPAQFEEASDAARRANSSYDYQEGLRAFAEKRPPAFEGR